MALTKISGEVIESGINIGIVTASTINVGSAVTIHTSGFQVGASNLHSTGISVRNINSTGVITSTTFVGSLTNNLTLNTSGTGLSGSTTYNNSGASTFTVTSNATNANTGSTLVARDASGNFSAGTITASLTGNATGLSNTPNITVGNIIASSAVISGNVSVAGTVTYEDVTNVDSVGVITARSGINVSGGVIVSGVTTVSAGSTLAPSISPTGNSNTGIFFPAPDTVAIGEGGVEVLRVNSNSNVGIGTLSPSSPLEIRSGNTAIINAKVANGQYGDIRITSEEGNELTIGYARNSTNYGAQTTAGDFSIKTTAPRLHFPIGAGNANSTVTMSASGLGVRNSSPDCTLSVGTGNIRMASGYSRMVSGFKSANASSFTMFDIVGIFREDLTELIIKHGHEGGGVHGSYRRWIFTSNAGNAITTFEDTNNINYGGGNGFSFTFPTYGTLRITWGGASSFAQDFYLACWIRCRNNITFTNQGMDSLSV